ncbi:MAG: hypothetical protein HYY18_14710 [Planctomycetes bacterium]|nr:hypothetical protein [Planctomycetota bacterium]
MLVRFQDPAKVNLLGHLFASILNRGLKDAAVARKVASLGRIGMDAGGMGITAEFGAEEVVLAPGRENCRAWVGGDMSDLLGVCLTGAFVGPWLSGRLRWGGNPFALLKLLAVLDAARTA